MQGVANYNKIIYNIDTNFRRIYLRTFFSDFVYKLLLLLSNSFNNYKNVWVYIYMILLIISYPIKMS